jgi:hypothetical protein
MFGPRKLTNIERTAAANWCGVDYAKDSVYKNFIPLVKPYHSQGEAWRRHIRYTEPIFNRKRILLFLLSLGIFVTGLVFVIIVCIITLTVPLWVIKMFC